MNVLTAVPLETSTNTPSPKSTWPSLTLTPSDLTVAVKVTVSPTVTLVLSTVTVMFTGFLFTVQFAVTLAPLYEVSPSNLNTFVTAPVLGLP